MINLHAEAVALSKRFLFVKNQQLALELVRQAMQIGIKAAIEACESAPPSPVIPDTDAIRDRLLAQVTPINTTVNPKTGSAGARGQ